LLTDFIGYVSGWFDGRRNNNVWIERTLQTAVIGVSLAFILHSLLRVHNNFLVVPYFDQWQTISKMAVDLKSVLEPTYFFRHHNEHIIATGHAIFLLDWLFFDMRNVLPVTLTFGLQLLLGGLIAWIACGDLEKGWSWSFAALSGVATVSLVQWQNLLWGFQVVFPCFLLSGILAILLVDRCVDASSTTSRWLIWLAAASAIGLCVFSFAAGILIGFSLLFLLIARRASWTTFLAVGGAWGVFVALFMFDYHKNPAGLPYASAGEMVLFSLSLVGSPFSRHVDVSIAIGAIGLGLFGALTAHSVLLPYLRHAEPDRRFLIVTAICLFAFSFVAMTALGRAKMGLGVASSARYATPALIFWIGVSGQLMRFFAKSQLPAPARHAAFALTTISALICFGFSTLRPAANTQMRMTIGSVNNGAFFILNDVPSNWALANIYAFGPDKVRNSYAFLRERHLSIFSPSAIWYQPPVLAHINEYPACDRWWIDRAEKVTPNGWAITGWALDHSSDTSPEWIIAFDEAGRRVGYTRALVLRFDVAAALKIEGDVRGFILPLRLPDGRSPGPNLKIVVFDGRKPGGSCRLVGAFDPAMK